MDQFAKSCGCLDHVLGNLTESSSHESYLRLVFFFFAHLAMLVTVARCSVYSRGIRNTLVDHLIPARISEVTAPHASRYSKTRPHAHRHSSPSCHQSSSVDSLIRFALFEFSCDARDAAGSSQKHAGSDWHSQN